MSEMQTRQQMLEGYQRDIRARRLAAGDCVECGCQPGMHWHWCSLGKIPEPPK